VSVTEARWDDPDFQVGDLLEIPVEFADFGRTAVLAAKQRIIQRVREGERNRVREEFADKLGELLSGEVQAIERGKLVVMLNMLREAEAIIPWREQNPRERFRQGEPIRAVLKKLEETPKGPRLILSRADPEFVAALFKLEVPEIYQGVVKIVDIAREAGGRTKIAVVSNDDSIDPVGACVGLKGSRVQAVVSEMSGERIDIVPWHPDPEVYAKRSLAPAKVAKVISDTDRKVVTAIVDEDQLSLAIGRNGQNVRLASQLIGWQIDLYSSREWMERGAQTALFGGTGEDEEVSTDFSLKELDIPPAILAALEAAGYETFLHIIDLERDDFLRIPGVGGEETDALVKLIEELTIVEEPAELSAVAPLDATPVASGEPVAPDEEDEEAEAVADAVLEAAPNPAPPMDGADDAPDVGDEPEVETVAAAAVESAEESQEVSAPEEGSVPEANALADSEASERKE
jgi:N utilization substance protein A